MPMMDDQQRIETLRSRCLERKAHPCHHKLNEFLSIIDAETLRNNDAEESWQLRAGERTASRLKSISFSIDDLELLAGRPVLDVDVDATDIEAAKAYLTTYPASPGQTGHCELDYSRAFKQGLPGLLQDIVDMRRAATEKSQHDAYGSFITALKGLDEMIGNAARVAESVLKGCDIDSRRKELKSIKESCDRLRSGPPSTFRDSIQLIWFVELAVMAGDRVGLVVPGHLDRWLWPFYQQDISSSALTKEEALMLLESLYLLINEYIPDGLAMSVMVGGRDPEGNDMTNELSYLCVESLRRTRLVYPTVGVCWHEETPQSLVNLTTELIAEGYTTPSFFCDNTIQKGLQQYDVPAGESCWYINSTCVEITPSCSSNVWVASPYFNTCQVLLDEIEELKSADVAVDSFGGFMERYFSRLGEQIRTAVADQNDLRVKRQRFGRKPLQSVFTRDCLDRGRDIDDGGARYNWVECSFVGLANLADSLYVIREEIFEKKKMGFGELRDLLASNFRDNQSKHQELLNCYPKYGNNQEPVDGLVSQVRDYIVQQCRRYRMKPDNSYFVPGAFCWIMHERLGRESGATPDGRLAGFPFADGGGPAQGRERSGPTSAILSTTSWDHSDFIGGVAFNMKFAKRLFRTQSDIAKLRELILVYMRNGGFEVQINVVDQQVLQKAKENPEQYRDLVVRIGGYTDYFTRLSPEMRKEVLLRTEFSSI